MVSSFFELLGILLYSDLVDVNMVANTYSIAIKTTWERIKPLVEGGRQICGTHLYHNFEYLYGEIKKIEQKLQNS